MTQKQLKPVDVPALLQEVRNGERDGFINTGKEPHGNDADLSCPYCGGSGHKDDAKPFDVVAVRDQAFATVMGTVVLALDALLAARKRFISIDPDWDQWHVFPKAIEALNAAPNAIHALSAEPSTTGTLPQDVINLVITAREVLYGGYINVIADEITTFDQALEAFASRIPWEKEPDELAAPTTEAGK